MSYNYTKFKNKEYTYNHPKKLKVGQKLPDINILTLNGEQKLFSEYFDKPIILETGSITCGMFAGQNDRMNVLAKKNTDFNFLILYVREVHPGKLIHKHNSIQDKLQLAKRFEIEDNTKDRTIIIDDLKGSFHQLLGALPNMVFIINRKGTLCYRNDWNKSQSLEKAIIEYKKNSHPIPQKWEMLPFPNITIEYKIFKRAGWDAALDFIIALPLLIYIHLTEILHK